MCIRSIAELHSGLSVVSSSLMEKTPFFKADDGNSTAIIPSFCVEALNSTTIQQQKKDGFFFLYILSVQIHMRIYKCCFPPV